MQTYMLFMCSEKDKSLKFRENDNLKHPKRTDWHQTIDCTKMDAESPFPPTVQK